jgi:hypothetical protein
LTVIVVVPVLVLDVGLKVAVTPEGRPVAVKATEEVSPPVIVSVMVLVTFDPPWVTVKFDGEAERVKFCTVKVNVVVRMSDPFVPVIVKVDVPPATVAGTVIVIVLVPDPVREVGLKPAVALVGRPLTVRLVAPVRSDVAVYVTVTVPLEAATIVLLPELVRLKPAVTASVADVL